MKYFKRLLAIASVLADVALWCALIALAAMLTIALNDHQNREAAMQRVHTAGMVAGLQLCPGSER